MHNKIIGCWIFPDGKIHMTNDIESHLQSLSQLDIKEHLLELSKSIEWTDDEKEHFCDSDLPYIAFKCNYIRILVFNNQIGIQHLGNIKTLPSIQKNAIAQFVSSVNAHSTNCIVLEKFLSDDIQTFYTTNDFLLFLD